MNTSFQTMVRAWLEACVGVADADNKVERNHRFVEEAVELAQSLGATKEEVLMLVDYVYGRPKGEPFQEVGGTLVTLAALCEANKIAMHEAAYCELKRVHDKIDAIRAKHATKPRGSPLPGNTDT